MTLWQYTIELPDGERRSNLLAAGNLEAATIRARRNADAVGARLVGEPTRSDAHRGTP